MHTEAADFARPLLQNGHPPVLEIGSRDVNGQARDLAPALRPWVGVDLRPGRGVEMVDDATSRGFPARYLTQYAMARTLVCMEVLEHCPEPGLLLRNLWECGELGGLLVLTTAGPLREPHSGLDGGRLRQGEPYQNFTREQLEGLLWGGSYQEVVVEIGRGGLDLWASARV